MRKIYLPTSGLSLLAFLVFQGLFLQKINAQVGCPGCNVSLPVLPADTIYLGPAPDGEAGVYYNGDISFRMPKTTTPVHETDPSTPAGLNISKIDIVAVVNVPPGLNWQPSQFSFNPGNQTDGCVKFCGTPFQPGLYEVEVFVSAEVLTINQSTSFHFPIYIAPASDTSGGFNLVNNSGCGEVTVSFENNNPSNGMSGYTYNWDFGNGTTSTVENPAPITYSTPGVYDVNYTATIDTFGYEVTTVRVLDASCDDIVINTKPDLYVKIKDPGGNFVVITDVQDNAPFPAVFNVNLPLGNGTYELEVRDEDTFGSESCGYIYFTKTTGGILTSSSGDLKVQVDIIHPVQTIQSAGTVTVYQQPAPPIINPAGTINLCAGEEVELVADYDENIQWHRDTTVLFGELYQQLFVNTSGNYWLEYTSPVGCKSVSDQVEVNVLPLPNAPVFTAVGNEYSVVNPNQLPSDYSLQWFLDGVALPDETGLSYCLMEPGVFLIGLEVTDNATGCTNEFNVGVSFNPAYTCASASGEIFNKNTTLVISPNPSNGNAFASFELNKPGEVSIQVFDAIGQLVWQKTTNPASTLVRENIDLETFSNGIYLVKIWTEDGLLSGRLLKQ